MNIAGREISSKLPPYIVAEISCNHLGILENAFKLMDAAKGAGADACKFQCYTPDTITLNCDKRDFVVRGGPWSGRKLWDLYDKTQTPMEWFPLLFAHGKEIGITVFSSVFDPSSVDFLETLDCPAYKIASMEFPDSGLIAHVEKTGKPFILSTGMATYEELYATTWGWNNSAFLHCVSGYPTPIEESNLWRIKHLWRLCPKVGISDHTLGWRIPVAATALGAMIIEKHLQLGAGFDFSEDSAFSLYPYEFKKMVDATHRIWQAMQPSERKSEEPSLQLRRSLYVVKDMKAGEQFTTENVRSIRPAHGMSPKELPRVLESFAAHSIERGTALEEGMLTPF